MMTARQVHIVAVVVAASVSSVLPAYAVFVAMKLVLELVVVPLSTILALPAFHFHMTFEHEHIVVVELVTSHFVDFGEQL